MGAVQRLNWQNLLNTYTKWPREIQDSPDKPTSLISMGVVKHFMGESWINDYLRDGKRDDFFRVVFEDEKSHDPYVQSFRITDLAELFFNLQNIEGFDSCISKMQNDIAQPTYAELDIGRMIYCNDWPFKFIVPQQKKRLDYDYEITLQDGLVICADAKCKLESTQLSEETIVDSLDHAKGQFPEDRPAIVIVKIPQQWMENENHAAVVLSATNKFFPTCDYIVSVVYYISPLNMRGKFMNHGHLFIEPHNRFNKFDNKRDWRLFSRWKPLEGAANALPPKWIRLVNFPKGFV